MPLDYNAPDGQTITLALKRVRAADGNAEKGTLFTNPGGPGNSGVGSVEGTARSLATKVRGQYDIIGFDPRGVGQSEPLSCAGQNAGNGDAAPVQQGGINDEQPADAAAVQGENPDDGAADEDDLTPWADAQATDAATFESRGAAVSANCAQNSSVPEILDHMDTATAARDMDVMRALVKDQDLNFFGYSYGTYLGAVYTELFPDNVGRVVLDSAMDPALSRQEAFEGDAAAWEQTLRTYIESQHGQAGFPLSGTTDEAVSRLATFLDGLDAHPLTVSDGGDPVDRAEATTAIRTLVVASPDNWPLLTEGLAQAMNAHDGTTLMRNAESLSGGGGSPGTEEQTVELLQSVYAFSANRCLDFPDTGNQASWDAALASYRRDYPVFHPLLPQHDAYCHGWGHTSKTKAVDVDVEATNPMLVIGILHDPNTPYPWSQALVSRIRNSHLLSVDMYGHGATGSNACTSAKVSDYLVNGTLPSDGEICPADPESQAGGGEKG